MSRFDFSRDMPWVFGVQTGVPCSLNESLMLVKRVLYARFKHSRVFGIDVEVRTIDDRILKEVIMRRCKTIIIRRLMLVVMAVVVTVGFVPTRELSASGGAGEVYTSDDGFWSYTLSGDNATIVSFNGKSETHVYILDEIDGKAVVGIGNRAFVGCDKLIEVDIFGDSITSIDTEAFLDCKNLKRVNMIDNDNISIAGNAFSGCIGLVSMCFDGNTIPSFTSVLDTGSSRLTSIYFPDSDVSGYKSTPNLIKYVSVIKGLSEMVNIDTPTLYGDVKAFYNNKQNAYLSIERDDISCIFVPLDIGKKPGTIYFKSYAFVTGNNKPSWKDIKESDLATTGHWDISKIINGTGRLVLSSNTAATNKTAFPDYGSWEVADNNTAGFAVYIIEKVAPNLTKIDKGKIKYIRNEDFGDIALIEIGEGAEYYYPYAHAEWKPAHNETDTGAGKWASVYLDDYNCKQTIYVRTAALEDTTTSEVATILPSLEIQKITIPMLTKPPKLKIDIKKGTLVGKAGWGITLCIKRKW